MSIPIAHFAVGTSCTMVIFNILPLRIRLKMRIAQVPIITLGGLWAMVPDIARFCNLMRSFNDNYWVKINLFGQIRAPDLTALINRIPVFHVSPWANICFFHQLMDVIDKNDSVLVAALLVLVMAVIASATFLKELRERRTSQHSEN